MGRILVGTCSWTDRALVGSGWYPVGRRDAEGRLRHYAERFPVVEVDASYYALPSERNSRLWAERTPDGFVFDVKAFSLLTGHPTREAAMPGGLRADHRDPAVLDEVWARFAAGIEPLREAGRLGSGCSSSRHGSGPGSGRGRSSGSAPSGREGGLSPSSSGIPRGGRRAGPRRRARCSPGTAFPARPPST